MSLKWRLGHALAHFLAWIFFRLRVSGQENLLKNTGQILVANHTSNIDPFLVGVASNQEIYFMAKEELFKISKFFTWLISFWNAIPLARNERASEALKKCSDLLKKNCSVLIFPEGTRNRFEALQAFKPGAGFLSVTNQVPIVPVAISGVKEIWSGRFTRLIDRDIRKKYSTKNSKKFITIKFGNPIYPADFKNTRGDYDRLTEAARKNITELLKENE